VTALFQYNHLPLVLRYSHLDTSLRCTKVGFVRLRKNFWRLDAIKIYTVDSSGKLVLVSWVLPLRVVFQERMTHTFGGLFYSIWWQIVTGNHISKRIPFILRYTRICLLVSKNDFCAWIKRIESVRDRQTDRQTDWQVRDTYPPTR
jgi:hypothetical protein